MNDKEHLPVLIGLEEAAASVSSGESTKGSIVLPIVQTNLSNNEDINISLFLKNRIFATVTLKTP